MAFNARSGCKKKLETANQKVNNCLRQFEDLSETLKVFCSQANMLSRCLDSLEDIIEPEVIGGEQIKKNSTRKHSHLEESFNDFAKIMISVSENIKRQAIEVFDNFITQVILPNDEEVKGILEHNSQIIVKFHEAFYSMFNHFLVLCAENLEHFLICSECSTPIGFTHQKNCIRKSMTGQSLWRKTKCDDKFITYGMKFNFYDIVSPEYRQNIIEKIKITCWEQQVHARNQLHRVGAESGPSYMSNSWPTRWLRGDGDRNRDEKKENKIPRLSQTMTTTTSSMKTNLQSPPLFQSSPWTPAQNDTKSMPTTKFEITTFAEQFKLDKLF